MQCYQFTVAAQEGPGIVIAHPGQYVELLCAVTEDLENLTKGWLIGQKGPYGVNAIRNDVYPGYNVTSLLISNLIVKNITMNDTRNGTEYSCVIVPGNSTKFKDIIDESDPTFLYVAGE